MQKHARNSEPVMLRYVPCLYDVVYASRILAYVHDDIILREWRRVLEPKPLVIRYNVFQQSRGIHGQQLWVSNENTVPNSQQYVKQTKHHSLNSKRASYKIQNEYQQYSNPIELGPLWKIGGTKSA